MPRKQIVQFDAAVSIASTDRFLLQQGVAGTEFTHGTVTQLLNGGLAATFAAVSATTGSFSSDVSVAGTLTANGNVVLGNAAGDTITIGSGTWALSNPTTLTRAIGSAASGNTNAVDLEVTLSGHADGTSSSYGLITRTTSSGANDLLDIRGRYGGVNSNASGTTTRAYGDHLFVWHNSAGTLTNAVVSYAHSRADDGLISVATNYSAGSTVINGSGQITQVQGFATGDLGGAAVNRVYGVRVGPTTAVANVWGIASEIVAASGRYNLYISGTAQNIIVGKLRLGDTTPPSSLLEVAGTSAFTGLMAITNALGASSATTIGVENQVTATGSGGTTDIRGFRTRATASGTAALANVTGGISGAQVDTTSGTTTTAYGFQAYVRQSGGGVITDGRAFTAFLQATTGSIGTAYIYEAASTSVATGGTIALVAGLHVGDVGHATAVTQAYGIRILNTSASAAVYGLAIETTSGSGKWALYSSGSAPSAHAGKLRVGDTTAPTEVLEVAGAVLVTTGNVYKVGSNQVIAARKTGWATATGTATRTTFDTATVTLPELAERVKAMIDDLHATAGHGLIGT